MKPELFIAQRFTFSKENARRMSAPIVKIAVAGIAIGLAVMILSVAIVTGFKNEVSRKVTGFGAHIQISNFDANNSFETKPISTSDIDFDRVMRINGIEHAQPYITKSGIIKTENEIQAVVLKGIDKQFDWSFMQSNLVDGSIFTITDSVKSNRIVISQYIANLLNLNVGDKITVYFVQDPPRMRPFIISGIYKTSIEDFDHVFALVDMRHLQKLNGWSNDQISGVELTINNFDQLYDLNDSVFFAIGNNFGQKTVLKISQIRERYPQIFDWLNLQDMNVLVILALMLVVACVNMISGLLILILERTNTIGLLKTFGYSNWQVQKIFVLQSFFLIIKGMIWGNVIGIGLCLLQKYFGIVPLDEASYYMSQVPINLQFWHVAILNIGTIVITLAVMLLPTLLTSKISPATTIKFN